MSKRKKIRRKGIGFLSSLNEFKEGEFLLVRSKTRKIPDAPNQERRKQELARVKILKRVLSVNWQRVKPL